MEPSTKATDIIKYFEASNVVRLRAYLCSAAVPTIGWGTTLYPNGKRVKIGDVITPEQAEEYLLNDMKSGVSAIRKLVKVKLTQPMFDALISLIYNIGSGAFSKSTMLRLLNEGKYTLASQQFARWNRVNGVPVAGLTRRRKAEQDLFNEGIAELTAEQKRTAQAKQETSEIVPPKVIEVKRVEMPQLPKKNKR
jgi:lysozyme